MASPVLAAKSAMLFVDVHVALTMERVTNELDPVKYNNDCEEVPVKELTETYNLLTVPAMATRFLGLSVDIPVKMI